ncbi:hypothetical protein VNI00_014032 [Paramarasmius palmivorus]|uniref:Uncharacterized protein n=1 Tax=Paramarasmius palmivorus TaxID=297713 RepID=A0AAW0BV07_9AGAR
MLAQSTLKTPIIVFPDLMSASLVRYLDALSNMQPPPLSPDRTLLQLGELTADVQTYGNDVDAIAVEIPLAEFTKMADDPNLPDLVERAFATLDMDAMRAVYVLRIVTLAMSRVGHTFQESIAAIRCSGILREFIRPADRFSPEQIQVMQMLLNGAVYNNIAVDWLAHSHEYGKSYGIKYPVHQLGDWDGNTLGTASVPAELEKNTTENLVTRFEKLDTK